MARNPPFFIHAVICCFSFANQNRMAKYKYIGEDKFFVKNGEILEGEITTWSVKKANSTERESVELLYVKNAGFRGEDMPINKNNLIEVGS